MDIAGWLRGRGLGQYEPVFRGNDIDGAVLPSLTTEDLGIASVGHRRRLLEAIVAPREGDEPTRPTAVADAAPSRLVMAGSRAEKLSRPGKNTSRAARPAKYSIVFPAKAGTHLAAAPEFSSSDNALPMVVPRRNGPRPAPG